MEPQINTLISTIVLAFKNVELGGGVSWHEADVLDNYGTNEERITARKEDEKKDWTKVPLHLIGDLKFQSVLPFLDARGLQFYLAPCMIFVLRNYKTSQSLIIHSLIYTLTNARSARGLQKIITAEQKECIISFLSLCKEIGDNYFDLAKMEEKMEKYWM